jgi:hypothetical protein
VERLQQRVERGSRGGGLLQGFGLGAGFAAAQQGLQAMRGLFDFVGESVFGLNSQLERSVAVFEQVTGSVAAARDVVAALRQEAARSPFSDAEILGAGRALIAVSERSTESLLELVRVAEVLASIDAAQGFEGATLALREALSGDFESLIRRFEIPRAAIARLRAEGVPNLEVVRRALQELGYGAELVERLGRSFEGRVATIRSFGDELRQRLGAGVFERVNDFLGRMVRLLETSGDALRTWADAVGETLGGVLERLATVLAGPLFSLLDRLAPGLSELLQGALAEAPQKMDALARGSTQAAQAVETLERRLGRLGVEAAGLQLEADRVRRAYDDQIDPLERQLRLLQQSADLQRVQNALASNRATAETLQLDREIAALARAAGAFTDPAAEGLTARQRAIALALQERQLRREELGLTEQQRPAVQALEQQLARLQEERRVALEPLERQLALRREEVAALQVQRQVEELNRQAAEATTAAREKGWQLLGGPEALAKARQTGQDLADQWLAGWTQWIEQGGGTIWGALGKTLNDWWETTGRPMGIRLGADLGVAVGAAAGAGLRAVLGPEMQRLQAIEQFVTQMEQRAAALQAAATTTAGNVATGAEALANTRETGAFGPTGLPQVREPRAPAGAPPAQISPTVNVDVQGGASAEDLRRARDETIAAVTAAFAQAEAQADPGASRPLAGNAR